MSLLTDPEQVTYIHAGLPYFEQDLIQGFCAVYSYFLQSLRLAFLRLDGPLAASSTAHLVEPLPTYALSAHAFHAGLASEAVPEFGLSRSPGPIPLTGSTSVDVTAGRSRPNRRGQDSAGPSRGLKYSETIVGRQGEKSAGTASAGVRVKGRQTTWKPKPHHLEAASAQDQAGSISRDRSAASTLREQPRRPPALIFDSPDDTPAGSLAIHGDYEGDQQDYLTAGNRQDGGDDNSDAGHETIQRVLDGYKPELRLETGGLSYALANQQAMSPSDSDPQSLPASRPAFAHHGSSSESPSIAMASNVTEDMEGDDTFTEEGSVPITAFEAGDESGEEEEDDFEFSLHGRDVTSSFEAVPPGVIAQPSGKATLLASPSSSSLPSIAEAIETGEANAPENAEDAALKAAQQARRQARRRVNISGRIPLPFSVPKSPDFAYDGSSTPFAAAGGAVPGTPSDASARRPHTPPISITRPGTPASASRPMSPSSPLAATLLRSRSGRLLKTRQRSQTDPVSQSPLPSPTKRPGSTSPLGSGPMPPLRHRAHTSQSLSTSPLPMSDLPNSPSAVSPDADGAQSVKPTTRRARSTGSAEGGLSPLRPFASRPALTLTGAAESTHLANVARDVFSAVPPSRDGVVSTASSAQTSPTTPHPRTRKSPTRSPSKPNDPYISFPITKKPVPVVTAPKVSALSVMLKSEDSTSSSSTNPFNENYGALFAPALPAPSAPVRRRGGAAANSSGFDVTMYYPFSKDKTKPLKLSLKPDLLVEEVVGCALWKYWESERAPSLCPASNGSNDVNWEERSKEDRRKLNPANWVLRIADEDEDGEVDDDFPAPDRTRGAKGFGTCFAIMEASAAQFKQNTVSDAQIQRRPSRIIRRMQKQTVSPQPSSSSLAPPMNAAVGHLGTSLAGGAGPSVMAGSMIGTPAKSYSMSGTTSLVYLRIRIPVQGHEDINTTLQVPLDMYMADVLDLICKKRPKLLVNPKDWMLTVPDRGVIVPLDRTVESLQGAHQLALQKKGTTVAGLAGIRPKAGPLANTNPNASIFKRLSEPPQPKYVTSADINTNYRSYVVQRKMPMPLGRHERILSLDNDYIHIMPSDTKLASGQVRTASYHISQVANCKTSRRAPSSFKLIVWRDKDKGDVKRYDFEAANGRMAAEIAQTVQAIMQAYRESVEPDV